MEKLVYCRICGQQVSSKARKCPHCGARLKRRHIVFKIILGIMAFVLICSIISSIIPQKKTSTASSTYSNQNGSGEKSASKELTETKSKATSKPTQKPTQKPTEKPTPEPLPGIGERLEENGVAVTLTNVLEISKGTYYNPKEGNVFILCEFVIENNTSKEIAVSSMLSFSFYYDGFSAPISLEALTAKGSANQLDGTIAAGKKFKGVVGYEIPKDWEELEVSFRPDVWYSSSFDYKINHEEARR